MTLTVDAHTIVKTMLSAADNANPGAAFALATVTKMSQDGHSAKVRIDGDSQESGVYYPILFGFGTMGPTTNDLPFTFAGKTVPVKVFTALNGGDTHGDLVTVSGEIDIPAIDVTVPGALNFPLSQPDPSMRVLLANVGHSMVILGQVSAVTVGAFE